MDAAALQSLAQWVACGGLVIGLIFGAVAAQTHFCTMGALADIANMADWTRARMWGMAIAVAIVGALVVDQWQPGLLDASMYRAARINVLSHAVGGLVFGFGMVIASGCGARTLVRAGGGNLKSLVVAVFLALGADMTLRGILAPLRANVLDAVSIQLTGPQDLGSVIARQVGTDASMPRLVLALVAAVLLAAFALRTREARSSSALAGGIVTGLVVVAGWYLTGHVAYIDEHPETLQAAWVGTSAGRPESLTFVGPQAYTLDLLLLWTDRSRVVTFGIATVIGTFAGSLLHALLTRRFRLEGFRNAEDTAHHLIGGLLMGFGGVTALGCTIGQGITGVSTLAIGSIITLVALVAGAWMAFRYLEWRAG
jgi:uncharacterized membrane protein YedE/YeeE